MKLALITVFALLFIIGNSINYKEADECNNQNLCGQSSECSIEIQKVCGDTSEFYKNNQDCQKAIQYNEQADVVITNMIDSNDQQTPDGWRSSFNTFNLEDGELKTQIQQLLDDYKIKYDDYQADINNLIKSLEVIQLDTKLKQQLWPAFEQKPLSDEIYKNELNCALGCLKIIENSEAKGYLEDRIKCFGGTITSSKQNKFHKMWKQQNKNEKKSENNSSNKRKDSEDILEFFGKSIKKDANIVQEQVQMENGILNSDQINQNQQEQHLYEQLYNDLKQKYSQMENKILDYEQQLIENQNEHQNKENNLKNQIEILQNEYTQEKQDIDQKLNNEKQSFQEVLEQKIMQQQEILNNTIASQKEQFQNTIDELQNQISDLLLQKDKLEKQFQDSLLQCESVRQELEEQKKQNNNQENKQESNHNNDIQNDDIKKIDEIQFVQQQKDYEQVISEKDTLINQLNTENEDLKQQIKQKIEEIESVKVQVDQVVQNLQQDQKQKELKQVQFIEELEEKYQQLKQDSNIEKDSEKIKQELEDQFQEQLKDIEQQQSNLVKEKVIEIQQYVQKQQELEEVIQNQEDQIKIIKEEYQKQIQDFEEEENVQFEKYLQKMEQMQQYIGELEKKVETFKQQKQEDSIQNNNTTLESQCDISNKELISESNNQEQQDKEKESLTDIKLNENNEDIGQQLQEQQYYITQYLEIIFDISIVDDQKTAALQTLLHNLKVQEQDQSRIIDNCTNYWKNFKNIQSQKIDNEKNIDSQKQQQRKISGGSLSQKFINFLTKGFDDEENNDQDSK